MTVRLSRAKASFWSRSTNGWGCSASSRTPCSNAYKAASDEHIEFGNEIKIGSGLRKEAADLFERIAAERRAKRKLRDR